MRTFRCAYASNAAEFAAAVGDDALWLNDAERYKRDTKVEPLGRGLRELRASAWITGRRRDQAGVRSKLQIVERSADGRLKINPLAHWSAARVWREIELRQAPINSLHSKGYKSIGDQHSTRAVAANEPERAGRTFGASVDSALVDKTECGIHSMNPERERRRAAIAAAKKAKSTRY